MRDAAVERLAKIISDTPTKKPSGNKGFRSRRPTFELRLGLEEGWFSLILLATVVYSTIWSVQTARWVEHLNILSLTTALGLICGVVSAKQERISRWYVHIAVVIFAVALAFWQTAGADYQGSIGAFSQGIYHWYQTVRLGGTSDDDSIFLFFIVTLSFLLAYTSCWLVYRTRSPWLMIVANAVVLLINLSLLTDASFTLYLVIFLIAALLLLLRINLYESLRRWKKQGLRYADDLGWDVMQAGSLISIGILIFSWIMPWNSTPAEFWSSDQNPWVQVQDVWSRVISVNGGNVPSNHGNFRNTLVLSGNPNLNNEIVYTVRTDGDGLQYLQHISYDSYDGPRSTWQAVPYSAQAVKANSSFPANAQLTRVEHQDITVVSPPSEEQPYIGGASQVTKLNVPSFVLLSEATGGAVAWVTQNGKLQPGTTYSTESSVSIADVATLRSVPMPSQAPAYPSSSDEPVPVTAFNPAILQTDLQIPADLDPRIANLAKEITANSTTMYDKAQAIQDYLRKYYSYSVDIQLPSGKEGIEWFLFESGNKGYCNYFASAMAMMARSVGIPSRVVAGYTNGKPSDGKDSHQRVIRGVDAHAWTQIYFAGYGWINFEPSASFSTFSRPLPNPFATGTPTVTNAGANGNVNTRPGKVGVHDGGDLTDLGGGPAADAQNQADLIQHVEFGLGGLILLVLFGLIFFMIWWQRLFRHYKPAKQLYGRICVMANWAGITLQPAQTPYECMQELSLAAPREAVTLERLGDIYVREQWADPQSPEHPRRSGEIDDLPRLWKSLQPRLFIHVLKHPYFLRWVPDRVGRLLARIWKRQRAKRQEEEEF